jgi:hypothetical protein
MRSLWLAKVSFKRTMIGMAYLHVGTGTLRVQTERVEGHAWFAHHFSITVVLEETA